MLKCYDKAIEINPNDYYSWGNKGVYYKNIGEYSKALKCYDMAIKINDSDDWLWQIKGECYYFMDEYDKAIVCFKRALKINPNNKDAKYDLEDLLL